MKIGIIGTGNVAWHLGHAIEDAGHVMAAFVGRDRQQVEKLSDEFYQAESLTDLNLSRLKLDLVIICVKDDAIESVAQDLELPAKCTLVHSSGTQPLSSLGYAQTENIGVFYPLQTFTKGKSVDFSQVPICIEADNENTLVQLSSLAHSISQRVEIMGSKERAIIHLSAVFASNFSNHMLTIAKQIMEREQMDYELLKPLIAETINKSLTGGPEQAQTGPAKRGDLETLDKQFEALSTEPETAELYKMISQHILDYYAED
jgi:predicted short-subunit dehydrogenase-like oxidoreductase (DUF2520 family)